MKNVFDILKERGFIDACTSEEVRDMLEKPVTVYCGFDPTAESLHMGNLVAIMGLAWFQRYGHKTIALVGGATAMIGDPSGKSVERLLLDKDTIAKNLKGIQKNVENVLSQGKEDNPPIFVNNLEWLEKFSFIDFLRDVGKYFRMGPMLAKDSVRTRLDSDIGMSFTEFSYQLLQSYDFLHLYDEHGATMQLGGSDQWGNITAGVELIRKVRGKSAEGLTFSLLTRSDGKKFGKTEEGTVWLSPDFLSPYEFYQYLVRVPDADVIRLLCIFTFMDMEEIRKYEEDMKKEDYLPNTAQKRLAEEVTRMIHGEEGLKTALKVTAGAAPGSKAKLDGEVLESLAKDMPSATASLHEVVGYKYTDVVTSVGFLSSKGEVRRLIRNKGAYINNVPVTDENALITKEQLIDGKMLLLGAGKKRKMLLRISNG